MATGLNPPFFLLRAKRRPPKKTGVTSSGQRPDSTRFIIIFFWPGENPWWLKNYKRKLRNLFGSEPYSGRSSSTKPSCSKTELKRCTTTEIRWNKNEDARTSPVSKWCLTVLPGARLQTRLWRPIESTSDPQRHWWGMQSFRASRVPTATLTASLYRRSLAAELLPN